eukprot:CAMPEP_0117520530 /NCGR_PEP_ID=MMETSP0784-20121206/33214_1 /TAXON_ID=39447 /ORGANISM="" /LENGTH=628 /DNA_ID=CAMNT_0005316523 /DNA_START=58 /DNA_END=1942 /DNA_ORIENTATION=-
MSAESLTRICDGRFTLEERIGSGGFGMVYRAYDEVQHQAVAVKMQTVEEGAKPFDDELKVYRILGESEYIPQMYWCGEADGSKAMVMELLSLTPMDLIRQRNKPLPMQLMGVIGIQMLDCLKFIHSKYLTHNDIKPDNFMFSHRADQRLVLIDFGLATPFWLRKHKKHQDHVKRGQGIVGSARFASPNAHNGMTMGRRDDLISLCYVIVFLLTATLPWMFPKSQTQDLPKEERFDMIKQCKELTTVDVLCAGLPDAFQCLVQIVFDLDFQEAPDYDLLQRCWLKAYKYSRSTRESSERDLMASETREALPPCDVARMVESKSAEPSDESAWPRQSTHDFDEYMAVWKLGAQAPYYSTWSVGLSAASTGESYGEIIRDYAPSAGAEWRFGRPNYAIVNKAYFDGRTGAPEEGSLEQFFTKLIKNWEVEARHVHNTRYWRTMDVANFAASANGNDAVSAQRMATMGKNNMLLGDMPGYRASRNTVERANRIFSDTFRRGFAFEVVEVYSGFPRAVFKWRHFGKFSGKFVASNGVVTKGDDQLVEVYGMCILGLTEDAVIHSMDVYYDRMELLTPLATYSCQISSSSEAAPSPAVRTRSSPSVHDLDRARSNDLSPRPSQPRLRWGLGRDA